MREKRGWRLLWPPRLQINFTAGVQFVSLASITHPDLVATAIADALEIQQVANRTIPQLIGDQLQDSGPFLLVLDNFEQVLPAATVVAETLEACPSLKILVTSRVLPADLRRTGISRERRWQQNSAIELFAQRAAAVWPDFAITAENATAIQEICSRAGWTALGDRTGGCTNQSACRPAPFWIGCKAACNC